MKSVALLFMISILAAGCTMEDMLFGVVVENESGVLKKAVKGVEFSFWLPNEKGEPSTVFYQGENFSLQLQIKNKTGQWLPFYDYGFYNTYDFFTLRSGSNDLGKPMKFAGYITSNEERLILPDVTKGFRVPWQEKRSDFEMMYARFEGLNQECLPTGKYFTKFTNNFKFGYPGKETTINTGKITFIINFEVK